jgi:hypothetical protein
MSPKAKRAREIQEAINRILYESWDPIGLRDELPLDEYNSFVGPIYRALANGGSEADIITVLSRLESDIGRKTPWTDKRQAAVKLFALKVSLDEA